MKTTDSTGHTADAIRFAPLRVETSQSEQGGPFYIMTRLDNSLGTRNNFALAECQSEVDAMFFASAPALLAALKEASELVKLARQYFPQSIQHPDKFTLENTNAAICKAIAQAERGKK